MVVPLTWVALANMKEQGASWNNCIAESCWKILWTLLGWLYSKRVSKIQGKIIGEMGGMADLDM